MELRNYIFFVFIFLTSCFSQSQGKNSSSAGGFSSKYYCEEFSILPPANRNWRKTVFNELSRKKYPLFFEPKAPSDLVKYCPNFYNLTDEEKKIIWLRVLDGMVFFESTCNPNAKARGPNGTAYGLLQLHAGREHDYQRSCRKNDSKNGPRSLTCGLNMIHEQLDQSNKVFFSGSYWEVLRPRGRSQRAKTIASHIWYYPLCQSNPQRKPPELKQKPLSKKQKPELKKKPMLKKEKPPVVAKQ